MYTLCVQNVTPLSAISKVIPPFSLSHHAFGSVKL